MVPTLALILAAGEISWVDPLIQLGAVGGVLVWFMFKTEPRLRGVEAAIDRMARSILLLVVSIPHATDTAKEQAKGIITEIDDAAKLRDPKP